MIPRKGPGAFGLLHGRSVIETDRVALPSRASIPDGVSDRTTQDAGRWAAQYPDPVGPTSLTDADDVGCGGGRSVPPCRGAYMRHGQSVPCGLTRCVHVGPVAGAAAVVAALPGLVLLTCPVFAGVVFAGTFPSPGGFHTVVAEGRWPTVAATWVRCLVACRRQWLMAGQVSGTTRCRVTGADKASVRGMFQIVVALTLLGVAAGAECTAFYGVRPRRCPLARRADHLTGWVVARGDTSICVRAEGATHAVDTQSPQDYEPGQRGEVLADGARSSSVSKMNASMCCKFSLGVALCWSPSCHRHHAAHCRSPSGQTHVSLAGA